MRDSGYGAVLFYYNNDPNRPIRKLFIDRILECVVTNDYGCMVWIGSMSSAAHPQMSITFSTNNSSSVSVARVLYQYEYGPINTDINLERVCLNTSCINPRHFQIKRS